MLKIRWTTQALDDLDTLTDYIAEDNARSAIEIFELIQNCITPATTHPHLFRRGRVPDTFEIVAHPNYVVVYEIVDDFIQVLGVLHSRQQYPK
ncbi:type II toxin-antitoxin system RelE/ParE family toxin [Candidatus Burkholderia verschuerenii]|uniref:type II toxin-antitoxin system RelE/ParE family toxin n=1 Tax=Candidatus Burkholderia verschuerenii TaxID=242163 RepID=UPI00067AF0B9|nr:type II toxin-antitoxin system mRNA interferase toxin, RelE/StbE family [Candidatus Burkholderia verschuerenii]